MKWGAQYPAQCQSTKGEATAGLVSSPARTIIDWQGLIRNSGEPLCVWTPNSPSLARNREGEAADSAAETCKNSRAASTSTSAALCIYYNFTRQIDWECFRQKHGEISPHLSARTKVRNVCRLAAVQAVFTGVQIGRTPSGGQVEDNGRKTSHSVFEAAQKRMMQVCVDTSLYCL